MEKTIKEIAQRIRGLREILGISVEDAAAATGVTPEQYEAYESGKLDYTFTFIYKCAHLFGVDVTDILKGSSPRLSTYSVTRRGGGLPIVRRRGFSYNNLAPLFKNKIAEPFYVVAKYSEAEQNEPIKLSTHEGQEFDIILRGSLKIQLEDHTEILNEGDSIYYDSSRPHGMIAYGGSDCEFLAVVMNASGLAYQYPDESSLSVSPAGEYVRGPDDIAQNYVSVKTDVNGTPTKIEFKNTEHFNFAYDVVEALAKSKPDKLALLHLDRHKNEEKVTFGELNRDINMAANYLYSLGIRKGDRVMLVLRRHHQFWVTLCALHKIGAVAIPATTQLMKKDYVYRFNAAGVSAVIATRDDGVPGHINDALPESPTVKLRIAAGGESETPEGWLDFDAEVASLKYSAEFPRTPDTACGDDMMLMYFTSGTTGYPKIAVHSHLYPLGHYVTARYWHNVNPNGVHLTIADTGWGKAAWGKIYGQWLCETCVFVYDFDRFHADDILSVIEKYRITTFCAPPTIYRYMIREDMSAYDLSSLEYATVAGEALNPEVFTRFLEATGVRLMEGFGQTETTVVVSNLVGSKVKLGSMGRPNPQYDVDIVDSDGKPVAVGEIGEIVIRTDRKVPVGLFTGYYLDEKRTKEAWHDGLYHTGDTAWRDEDGYYFYVGRTDDLIKSSGYRIGPFEIESVIMELPYVLEVAVTGVKDELRGNVVKATIVLTKGTVGTEELKTEIQNYVKEHTALYKYPRIIEFVDELPKTISGKIRRGVIRGDHD
ncbi:MAG: AMP-binding protein [Clostridiales bacterium]|jgi:acetyl-CoA synthetase|nr:AMP-binding protein [Clostridiales bacterium]